MSDETSLYRHFDKTGRLLYVGVSLHAIKRLSQHRDNSHWYSEIARVDIEQFPSRETALAAERKAIQKENPLHNRQLRKPPEPPKPEKLARAVKAIERPLLQLNPLYKFTDAAAKLCMSTSHLKNLIEAGQIGYVEMHPPRIYVVNGQTRVQRAYGITGWQIIEYLEHLERKGPKKEVPSLSNEHAAMNGKATEAA